jgi:uncharacterized membrane protein
MKISLRFELFQLLILAAAFVWAGFAWDRIPDVIPVHWDLQGEVDGNGGKFSALLLTPIVAVGAYLLMLGLPFIDPGRANYEQFAVPYTVARITLLGFLAVYHVAMQFIAFGYQFNMNVVLFVGAGVVMVILGNMMGKIRPNWFVGVKTPWTLSSKESWTKTHRLAGRLLVIVGLLSIVTAWSSSLFVFWLNAAALLITVVWSVVYSYLVWKKDPNRIPPAGTSPGESTSK